MKKIFKQDIKVLASQIDIKTEMGLVQSVGIIQDNMCEYFKELKCDGLTLIPQCGCFFVVTKTKVSFNRFAKWLDVFKVSTELFSKSRIVVNLKTDFTDNNTGEVFAICYQELCAMDKDSRKLRMINTTPFPVDLDCISDGVEKVFDRFAIEYSDADLVDSVEVKNVNIDMYRHTNNVEYVRFLMSTFDIDFISSSRVTDFEIHYVSESKLGDILDLYRTQVGNNVFFEIRCENAVVARAKLAFCKIQ